MIRSFFSDRRVRYLATAAVVVLVVISAFLVKNHFDKKTYHNYEVVKSADKSSLVSRFTWFDGYVVRYMEDGATLLNKNLESVWSLTYSMGDPQVDTCGDQILIYDRGGTGVYIYNEKGKVSSFETADQILLARISAKDTIAVLMRNGEKESFVYYTKDGVEIASGISSMSDPGYPFAMDVSNDGMNLAISYLTCSDGNTGSEVRFYHFENGGGGSDRLQGELRYSGVFVPELEYLNGKHCMVIRDDGFTVAKDLKNSEHNHDVVFQKDIVSTFHDNEYMGFIFRSEDAAHRFEMQMYSAAGNHVSTAFVDFAYTGTRVCGNEVIMNNSSDFAIYSMDGVCRFTGKVKSGSITDVLKLGRNRYLLVTDQQMQVIRLQ